MSTSQAPRYDQPPANDAGGESDDVRDQLRKDHEMALAELDALCAESDERRSLSRLRALRQGWMVHALAEESVVYRALEGVPPSGARADERFIEHELVGGLFERLLQARPGSLEWKARLNVVRGIMARHMQAEHDELFGQLARRFGAAELAGLGRAFLSARDKLAMLEQAKAA